MQKWTYHWLHIPTGASMISETLSEMSASEFLSALAWWNMGNDWRYWPVAIQPGIIAQHLCRNVRPWSLEDGTKFRGNHF